VLVKHLVDEVVPRCVFLPCSACAGIVHAVDLVRLSGHKS